jgi:HlyD family secretion protein
MRMTEAEEAPFTPFGDDAIAEPLTRPARAPRRTGLRRLLNRRLIAGLVVIAILAVAGGILYFRRSTDSVTYRTAQAALGTVTQTLSLSGNLAPMGETDLDFGSSGRVATVAVQPGQKVTAGQVLATLDTTSLQGTLTQAQANLTSAQAKLSLDQAGPTSQSLQSAQAQVNSAQVGLSNAQTALTDTENINAVSLSQAQSAVTAAQNTVNADQTVVAADQQKAQADQGNSQAEAADQQKLATDNQTLSKDQGSLSAAQSSLQATQSKVQQGNDQAKSQVATSQVQLNNALASLSALQQGATSQQITQDQSAVQVAQVNVTNAQRAIDQATITAVVAGTVGQVNITVGESVTGSGTGSSSNNSSAASSSSTTTHHITLLTPGAFQVSGTVSDTQVNLVAVGQRARVTPAGSSQAVTGKVTEVDSVATVTSGVATFGVIVALDGSNPSLHAGVSASIQIIINQVVQVVTVPTSAVQNGSVQLMVNGVPQTTPVTVGASDPLRTQILSGINVGDTIVIATVSSSLPTPSTGANGAGGIFGAGGRVTIGGGGGGGGGAGRAGAGG